MITVSADSGSLILSFPYSQALVTALKMTVPATDRQWDGVRKVWYVTPQYGQQLAAALERATGQRITLPAIQTVTQTEQKILDIRYIGMTKERDGSDVRTAFGWSQGSWSVIFPEATLRTWFDAPSRPDEESTLYQVLAVQRDVDAGALKSAYRRLARQWHPDVCRENGAADVFKHIQHAWEILSDERTRRKYDAGLMLAASVNSPANYLAKSRDELSIGYRSPLRCGLLMVSGCQTLGRFRVERIEAWEDIVDFAGRVLVTSWPIGAAEFREEWA